jgi:predicted DNA-binding WGR domain protein
MKNYFEYQDNKSHKFWEITLEGLNLTTCYGKINTDGQVSEKTFESIEKAEKEYNKLIAEKTKKGYKNNNNLNNEKMENSKKINLEEALELISQTNSELNEEIIDELKPFYEITDENIVLYSGDTDLKDFLVGNDICIINGNLTVNNLIEDCNEVDSSLLIVLGNVKCKNLITLSSMHITGDLIVDNVILGDSLCDYALNVGGNIKTETILDYGHSIVSFKKITAATIFSFNSIEDEKGTIEANLTSEDLVDEIVEIDNDERIENLSKTIDFIKNGGTKFHK